MKTQCTNVAAYRFTWPGKDESFICEAHKRKLRMVADAMYLPLQIIELDTPPDQRPTCHQNVKS